MIHPNEINTEIRGSKLLITHIESNTIIAEIKQDRTFLLNVEFRNSLTEKAIEKINHIAKYFDSGIEVELPSEESSENYSFVRLMNERPIININDICILRPNKFLDEKRKDNKFRIDKINLDNTVNLLDTLDHKKIENVSIDIIILYKEYHENLYYVQNGYIGNAMMWWALDSKGYTIDITKAHKFTYDEAMSILKSNEKDKRRNEKVFLCDFIDNSEKAKKLIIDSQYLDNITDSKNQLTL